MGFTVGRIVKIKDTATTTFAKNNIGRVGRIIEIVDMFHPYAILDFDIHRNGVYLKDLKLVIKKEIL